MPYYFYLPLQTDLTVDQQRAVDMPECLSLGGGPGTGKSVVCLWRHIANHSTGQKVSLLLTYTKTLEHYLRASAATTSQSAAEHIDRVYWWLTHNACEYEEIIIDEGQDIKREKFQRFFAYTSNISYGADERQSMYLKANELDELLSWLRDDIRFSRNTQITLNKNFRNSREILLFTRAVFPNVLIPQNTINQARTTNLKPIIKSNLGWGPENQIDSILSVIEDFYSDTHNIAILVPFVSQVESYFRIIRERLADAIEVTKYQNEQDDFEGLSTIHVTTFKSSKGTEFDTVIMPEFDAYSWNIANRPEVVTDNDYYVAFTRSKTNLFLLCRGNIPNFINNDTVIVE